jgi:hypothetical protein
MWVLDRWRAMWRPRRAGTSSPGDDQVEPIGEVCRLWRQGDVFLDTKAYFFDQAWRPTLTGTANGSVVISQTCDAGLPNRPMIQLAPAVKLVDQNAINQAADGKRPQYVPIPQLGGEFFGDLEIVTTVAKTALRGCERIAGVQSDDEVRQFAFAVARRFGRFAYPDEVVKVLEPVSDILASKARRENSPLGKVLANVNSFRVQCEDWSSPPYYLSLLVIMDPGVLPPDFEKLAEPDDLDRLAQVKPADSPKDRAAQYAGFLSENARTPAERYFAWMRLTESWASQCEAVADGPKLAGVVRSVVAEMADVDEFPLARVVRSESLDLDYISDSRKPIT